MGLDGVMSVATCGLRRLPVPLDARYAFGIDGPASGSARTAVP